MAQREGEDLIRTQCGIIALFAIHYIEQMTALFAPEAPIE
jgi:hypothetical protein